MADPYATFSSPVAAGGGGAPPKDDPYAAFSSPAQPAKPEPATAVDRAAAGASGVNRGIASLVGVPASALVNLSNLASIGLGYLHSKITGEPAPESIYGPVDKANVPLTSEWNVKQLGAAGEAPRPDDTASRFIQAAGEGATAAIAPGSAGARIPAAISGIVGSQTSQVAREAGASPEVQMAAGLVGGVLPSAVRAGAAAGTRQILRGGEEGRQRVADNIATFKRAGIEEPSVGQVTEGRTGRGAESFVAKIPGGAGRMTAAAEKQAADMGGKIEELASSLAPKSSGEQAGRAITKGISGDSGFVSKFKAKQETLYDDLDKHIPKDSRVDVTNTAKALKDLNADIPGAPNISEFFKNAKIKGIQGALRADTEGASALAARTDIPQFAGAKAAKSTQGGSSTDPFRPTPSKDPFGPATKDDLDLAASLLNDGKLPYEALKKLRTLVGREMADSGLMSDVPRSKWKALYGALSTDLETAAKQSGPEATTAFNRANTFTRAGMKRLEVLDSVVDKAGGPEAVFRAATNGTKEGATTIRAVMQSLPDDARKTVSATVLRRMGRATAGKQDDLGEKFSTETFLTNWNTLSPQAKAVLFDRHGPTFRADMDAVAKVASNLRDGSKVFVNPSGTGQAVAQTSAGVGFITALATGHLVGAGAVAGTAGLANIGARAMTNPRVVNWLAKAARSPQSAKPALIAMAARSDDQDLRDVAAALSEAPDKADKNSDGENRNR